MGLKALADMSAEHASFFFNSSLIAVRTIHHLIPALLILSLYRKHRELIVYCRLGLNRRSVCNHLEHGGGGGGREEGYDERK